VIALLVPFLVADAILLWMLRDTWRNGEVWLATRMGRREDNRTIWWMTVARLGVLLALSLVGTVAALLA
jgi:hypothetical protein